MKSPSENYDTKGQLAHVEREQVDIRADIKIIQHDIVAIKENMATKSDIVTVRSEISEIHHKIDVVESKLEGKIDRLEATMSNNIGWLKAINIAILATVMSIAFAPVAQNMFKAPVQEVIPVVPSKK
jgi:chromosome segregation ATPase